MKTKAQDKFGSKNGGALLMVLLALLFVSIMQLGLLKLREADAVETVFVEDYKQAFWMAESGITDGEMLIQYDKSFRNDPTSVIIPTVNASEVGGSYNITVTKTTVNFTLGIFDYTITSIGTVNGISRRLQKNFRAYPGGKYAIIGITGATDLAANVHVDGPIAQIAGTISVHDSRLLDDYLILGDGEGALDDRRGEATVANFPPPPAPSINSSTYDSELAKFTAPPSATVTNITTSLSGDYYINGPVEFDGKISIAADSKIVVNGDVRFDGSGTKIGDNVQIISANDVSFKVQASIGAGAEIYANQDIHFESGSKLFTGDDAVLLMAKNGDIIMDSNFDFRGIMIAENGQVELNSNGDIQGTIIGGVGVDAAARISITYDESVFTDGTPVIPSTFGDVVLVANSWQELPPL